MPMDDTSRWLIAWDSHGWHRTATPGDEAGADWLAHEVRALGAAPGVEHVPLARLDPVAAWLEVGGTRYDGVPVFDAPSTDAAGISAALGPEGIEVATLSPWEVYSGAYRTLRQTARHKALVIRCEGAHPGLGLLNAEQFNHPFGAPAIHVAGLPDVRGEARFVSHSVRTAVHGRNVVVTLPGRDRGRPPVVVMTPRSSWWHSTSERGGGLVCWLETLRALLANPPGCDVVLTANTGHELGHLGLDDFLARRPGWEQPGGATWVHYGANLGAVGGRLSVMSASDDLRSMMTDALAPLDHAVSPATQMPNGETRDIHLAGGRYVTLVGSNPLFHLPQDRWPHAVDPGTVTRIANAAARMVVALTR